MDFGISSTWSNFNNHLLVQTKLKSEFYDPMFIKTSERKELVIIPNILNLSKDRQKNFPK